MNAHRLYATILATALVAACSAGGSGDPKGGGGTGSGTGGSGGGIPMGGTGGGIAVPDSGQNDAGLDPGCASDSYTGELVPVGMYLLLDHSGSMSLSLDADAGTGPSKWSQVTKAITDFMGLPGTTGISMGMGFFPVPPSVQPPVACTVKEDCYPYSDVCMWKKCMDSIGGVDESCIAEDYHTPAVGIAPLPGVASDINSAIAGMSPTGNTPMTPALQGTMDLMVEWAGQNPEQIALVVLATDGMPTGCVFNDVADVAAVAEGGLGSGVSTFVIGIGDQLSDLNLIAQKGGTDKAFIIGAGDVGGEFLAALNAIRGSVGCNYKMPKPQTGDPDPNKVNVAFTPEGGAQQIYPKVGSAADCKGEKGWYYDNPQDPNQIILCPASCDEVQSVKGKVDVVLGCKSVVK
ncbi:MAG: hypothetical protein HY898_26410 [Deltaproteobacteria bacterium]|nr:hypothetical protein [Deltaproteobacteria bacterium]